MKLFPNVLFRLFLLLLLGEVTSSDTKSDTIPEKKLVALFHVGPGKTGTTHLQSFFVKTEKILHQNDFAVWPSLRPAFEECIGNGSLPPFEILQEGREKQLYIYHKYFESCLPIQNLIRHFIHESAKLKRNIILSSETFLASSACVRNILDMLVAEKFQIHGIISYRFPLNWFKSLYNEVVAFKSISSRESNPSKQLNSPLFSDYLNSDWNRAVKVNKVDVFHDILSKYPDYLLSIIDVYGTAAAQKELSFVFLCEIAGVMCDSQIFEELKSLNSHTSETESVILERQMGFVFAKFASLRNCTLNFSGENSKARKYLRHILTRHKWKVMIPQRSVDISDYARQSLDIDKYLRSRYGKYFVNGNMTANVLKVTPLPSVMEVDREYVNINMKWIDRMTLHLTAAKRKGLCVSESTAQEQIWLK